MSKLPEFPIEGGCACGHVRYSLSAPPALVYTCHCAECQVLSASAFSTNGPVRKDSLTITKGELTSWLRVAKLSGNKIPQHVCPKCGVRVFTEPPGGGPQVTLRLGTLDDTSWIYPGGAIWMAEAQPWVCLPEGMLSYPDQPADFRPMAMAWRAAMELD